MMISIILPAYQEAANLKRILPKLHESLKRINEEYEILVVDTMTPMDDTPQVCKDNQVVYINRINGNFYGDAMRTGFQKAQGNYIVVMDADGSHNPDDIVRFYNCIKKTTCNLVIGSRYCKGGYTDNNFVLRFMSWMLNTTYRFLFGLKVKDVSDSFRMYTARELKSLELECDNFDIVEEILIKLNFMIEGFRVVEVPISFSKRAEGQSKRDLWKFIRSYVRTMSKLLRIKRRILKNRHKW